MDSRDNFILGRGERLVNSIQPPAMVPDKVDPYTVGEALDRLMPQLEHSLSEMNNLSELATPNGEAVLALTLHPAYIAKSYYPKKLFKELGVEAIGSKGTLVKPEKWTRVGDPVAVRSVTLFVRGRKDALFAIPDKIAHDQIDSLSGEIIKIEKIESVAEIERVKPVSSEEANVLLEVALHARPVPEDDFIIRGFEDYIQEMGLSIDSEKRLYAEGLCFMALKAPRSKIDKLNDYNFLRVAREMPHLRPIPRSGDGTGFDVELPEDAPLDPSMRVAVFDGGIADDSVLNPWVRPKTFNETGAPIADLMDHGQAVTGALLFGPLKEDAPLERPYCYVDHYRVFGENTNAKDENLLDVLKLIQDTLESSNYSFVNLSIGPYMPIEDDEVTAWSSVLDRVFKEQDILAAIAAGNTGHLDRDSGNARIQPPSDAVNALAVGASDRQGPDWNRANYSSFGPGRSPGLIKPDLVTFGGSSREPFYVFASDSSTAKAVGIQGTSFASPYALRTAIGVRATFGDVLTPTALKALLIHSTEKNSQDKSEVGWGRVPEGLPAVVTTPNDTVRIVYQGSLSAGSWIKAPIPMPFDTLSGKVEICATVTYMTDTNPQDSANYTKAGVEMIFRPHADKRKKPTQRHPDSSSFFQIKEYGESVEDDLTYKAHFWETALSASKTMFGKSLKDPAFNLHYNARDGVGADGSAAEIDYALVITVKAIKHPDLYNKVMTRYSTILEPIRPLTQIPIQVEAQS